MPGLCGSTSDFSPYGSLYGDARANSKNTMSFNMLSQPDSLDNFFKNGFFIVNPQ